MKVRDIVKLKDSSATWEIMYISKGLDGYCRMQIYNVSKEIDKSDPWDTFKRIEFAWSDQLMKIETWKEWELEKE